MIEAAHPNVEAARTRPTSAATRSCIEGGGDLMVTLHAPGPVTCGTAVATTPCDASGSRHWTRRGLSSNDTAMSGETLMFMHARGGSYTEVLRFLGHEEPDPRLSERMAGLRNRGRIYMATRNEPETGETWLSVALDRRVSIRQLLAEIGPRNGWEVARRSLSRVFGRDVNERTQPWSVALPLSNSGLDRGRIRVGTAAWGRMPEIPAKRVNMAHALQGFGGDGEQAAREYSALMPNANHIPIGFADAIGSAAEVDIEDEGPVGLLLTLRTKPNSPRIGDL